MGTLAEEVWVTLMWTTLGAVDHHKQRRILDDLFADLDPHVRHALRGHLYPWLLGTKPACDLIFTRYETNHLVALVEVKSLGAAVNWTSLERYASARAGEDPLSQRIVTASANSGYVNLHQGDGYRAYLGRQPDEVHTFTNDAYRDHGRFIYLFIAPGKDQLRRWKVDLISHNAWEFINLTDVTARWRSLARSIPELWPLVVASEEFCGL